MFCRQCHGKTEQNPKDVVLLTDVTEISKWK